MGVEVLTQLLSTMLFAALCQQIDHFTTSTDYPVRTTLVINKPKYFDAL